MENVQQALIIRDDARMKIQFTPAAVAMRDAAMAGSAMIGKVGNPEQNELAVSAQRELYRVQQAVEKARQEAKAPILEFGRAIDQAAKDFLKDCTPELGRVATLIGSYQALEEMKRREAEKVANERLLQIEREKAAAMAKVKTHEEADAIAEHFNRKAAAEAPPLSAPVRAEGQSVRSDWEITVINIYDLAKYHPDCVKIEPKLSEIKAKLNEGINVVGIKAERVTKSGVRLERERKAIEV